MRAAESMDANGQQWVSRKLTHSGDTDLGYLM